MAELFKSARVHAVLPRLGILKVLSIVMLLILVLVYSYNNVINTFYYRDPRVVVHSNSHISSDLMQTNQTASHRKARDLLLFSYMRSGSSLTGALLMNSSDTFYVFEPLIPLAPYHYLSRDQICRMRDTVCSYENATRRLQEAFKVLINIYTCNIKNLPEEVVKRILAEKKSGKPWLKLGECLTLSNASEQHIQCYDTIEHTCKEASSVVTKVLRLSFIHVDRLLQNLPNLNVLFLIRDPRAILNSRIETDWFPISNNDSKSVEGNVHSLCNKMEDDFWSFEEAEAKHRNRVAKMRIEDITISKEEMVKVLNFINKPITQDNYLHIDAVFKKKAWKGGSLFRSWRKQLKTEYRDLIEGKCPTGMKFYDL